MRHGHRGYQIVYNVETVDDLDRLVHFPTAQSKQLEANLHEVADVRLEEESTSARTHLLWFYMQGIWRGRADIARAILQAKPWEFPFRLSRLTTAAMHGVFV